MTASSSGSGIAHSTNRWSRILGVSLRPWSGESPASLVIRGAIQIALCLFFVWFAVRLATDDEITEAAGELASLRLIAVLIIVPAVVVAAMGVARVGVGIIDFLSSGEVTGTVMSVRDRRTFDFLPHPILEMIYRRNTNSIDRRKRRTEVVLRTDDGVRQWTVRKSRARRDLRPGSTVRLTVTPLAGYISRVTTIDG